MRCGEQLGLGFDAAQVGLTPPLTPPRRCASAPLKVVYPDAEPQGRVPLRKADRALDERLSAPTHSWPLRRVLLCRRNHPRNHADESLSAQSHPPQAHDNYRVILKREDGEFEIGSIRHPARRRLGLGHGYGHPDARFGGPGDGQEPQVGIECMIGSAMIVSGAMAYKYLDAWIEQRAGG